MRAKQDIEYNLTELKLNHSFTLKMAMLICWSVVSIVIILSIASGLTSTLIGMGLTGIIIVILGIISFSVTRSACV